MKHRRVTIIVEKEKRFHIISRYLTPQQKKTRLIIVGVVFIFHIILQAITTFGYGSDELFGFAMVPILLSGWLLGPRVPVLVGLCSSLLLTLFSATSEVGSKDWEIGMLITLGVVIIGITMGRLSDFAKKARLTALELEKAKNEADVANKSKSEFLASISHEIRTPMNSIIGFASLLRDDESNEQKKEKLSIIVNAGNILLSLINDLLDFSKIEAGEIDLINLEFSFTQLIAPIKNIFSLKAKEKNIQFEINLDESLPYMVLGDERRIQQIFINLVSNAIKFTEKGKVTINCSYANGNALIEVIDTGIGIPKDKQNLIFGAFKQVDPSFTREYGGTGLGLAITKKLTKLMNGTINLQSEVGVGSHFKITIPLVDLSTKYPHYQNSYKINNFELDSSKQLNDVTTLISNLKKYNFKFRVLIAEDNDLNREFMKQLLSSIDVSFDFAVDGQQTLEKLRTAGENEFYDLLLLDIQMPIISGTEVIKQIREDERLKDLYVIALTAYAMKGDEQKYIDAGCNFYIPKPVDRKVLTNKLYHLIMKKIEKTPRKYDLIDDDENTSLGGNITVILDNNEKRAVRKIIEKLRQNYELFDPLEIKNQKKELEKILPTPYFNTIRDKIDTSIRNYDDEILVEIIKLLEVLL